MKSYSRALELNRISENLFKETYRSSDFLLATSTPAVDIDEMTLEELLEHQHDGVSFTRLYFHGGLLDMHEGKLMSPHEYVLRFNKIPHGESMNWLTSNEDTLLLEIQRYGLTKFLTSYDFTHVVENPKTAIEYACTPQLLYEPSDVSKLISNIDFLNEKLPTLLSKMREDATNSPQQSRWVENIFAKDLERFTSILNRLKGCEYIPQVSQDRAVHIVRPGCFELFNLDRLTESSQELLQQYLMSLCRRNIKYQVHFDIMVSSNIKGEHVLNSGVSIAAHNCNMYDRSDQFTFHTTLDDHMNQLKEKEGMKTKINGPFIEEEDSFGVRHLYIK